MRKIYSLVLLAVGLLIGTNAWAAVHDELLDNDVASVTKGSETMYAATLQEAIDHIGEGETGTVTLIGGETVLTLTSTVKIPHIEGAISASNPAVLNRAMQHITLDLNGHNIKSANTCIALAKGELFITGTGIIEKDGKNSSSWQLAAIAVSGAAGDKTATEESHANDHSKEWWSILTIDEHVVVKGTYTGDSDNSTPKAQGIAIINIGFNHGVNSNNPSTSDNGNLWTYEQLGYETFNNKEIDPMWFRSNQNEQGSAFGVKVTIKGEVYGNRRGLHVVGHVNQKPYALRNETGYHAETQERYEIGQQHPYYYEHYYPWIIITSTGKVHCTSDFYANDEVAGLYVAGWAVVDISGEVYGQNGIFAKAGNIELNENAYIHSESPEYYNQGFANGKVSGNGIFLTTDGAYSGEMSVDINGNSKISGGGGAAIIEVVATATTTPDVNHITINGGTITGGDQGAILLTEGSADKTVAYGGSNISGAIQKDGQDIEVSEITADGTHVINVTDPETGKTTIVISTGEDPTAKATWADVAAIENRGNANWTGLVGEISNEERVELGELQMKAGDENNSQVLTIHDGGALVVNHLVMNAYARIIVEAGGLLVVDGPEGVYSNSVENILLETTATKHATFLYHPNVATNSHPKATVEFATTSFYKDANTYEAQRFGIPTWGALESFTCDQDGVYSQIFAYDKYQTYDWVDLGYLQGGTPFDNVSSMNKPFDMYNLMAFNYQNIAENTYKMKGSLVGNANTTVNANLDWNSVANSYTADIDVAALIANLEGYNNVNHAVYIPKRVNNQLGYYSFEALNSEWLQGSEKIAPMTIFMLCNTGADRDIVAINYKNLVWDPATTSGSNAPRRAIVGNNNSAKLRIIVTDEQGVWDDVKMTENATKSSASPKYINDDMNIYAQGDEKYAIIANDNLEDTYFGFSTVKGGEFTISFANVEGREFNLIDVETGAMVAAKEGETYTFSATPNTVADYRFKLVEPAKVATAIENTEAVKSAKGVYTITGQYLGEMNVWNTLPAGVYVVNGAKCVK